MTASFRCGCPRSPENTYEFKSKNRAGKPRIQVRCKTCHKSRAAEWTRAVEGGTIMTDSQSETLILALLRRKPSNSKRLAVDARLDVRTVQTLIRRLRARNAICVVGVEGGTGGRPTNLFGAVSTEGPKLAPEPPRQERIAHPYPEDIRIAQKPTIPQYRYSASSRQADR